MCCVTQSAILRVNQKQNMTRRSKKKKKKKNEKRRKIPIHRSRGFGNRLEIRLGAYLGVVWPLSDRSYDGAKRCQTRGKRLGGHVRAT